MPKTLAVIDGNSLMHRAFHGVPLGMSAKDGTPTNAVFGFVSMLLKFINEAKPDAIVCAFDTGRPASRIEKLPEYKANRPPTDPDLKVQFPLVEEVLRAMNIPMVRITGAEGDDILGSLSARSEELGFETLLLTGDKDCYQLADEHIRIVTTKKGVSDVAVYGPAEVYERYGVRPDQFRDFLGLKGDSVDNIPGVTGVGDKTAAKLLQTYGSLEGIYARIDELKGSQKKHLLEDRQKAFISRDVATIARDLPIDIDLRALHFPDFDAEGVQEVFGKLRFNKHLHSVLALAPVQTGEPACANCVKAGSILSGQEAQRAVEQAHASGETFGLAFCVKEQENLFDMAELYAFAASFGVALFEGNENLAFVGRILSCANFVSFDIKADLKSLVSSDSSEPAYLEPSALDPGRFFDVSLAAYELNSSQSSYTLESVLDEYLALGLPETDDEKERVGAKAQALRLLQEPLRKALSEDGSLKVYEEIDAPLIPVLLECERVGAAIDCKRLFELGRESAEELAYLHDSIIELAGQDFNIDSPKQLSHILFDVLGLPPGKKTATGYSTDAAVLKELSLVHELPEKVLRYRELAKIKSTYIDALPRMRAGDGRVHTNFNLCVTATGRLSSSEPNLQNIPVRSELGKKIRACFVPLAEGEVFMSADYSQIELRLLAHLSQDEHLIAAFKEGFDFHTQTAARVFGLSPQEVTPEMRSRAKAVNFGIVYGQQAFGLSSSLGIPFAEAREMIERYFEAYPQVRAFLDVTVAEARERLYAQTIFGRKRHIPELARRQAYQRAFGERSAMNHPMQGSAADIIKLAMTKLAPLVRSNFANAKMLLQVHDELDFSVDAEDAPALAKLVKETMENVVSLRVPLLVDVAWGANWAEAH